MTTPTTTPTPAEFLALPVDPDEDVDVEPQAPLESIAESLRTLVDQLSTQQRDTWEEEKLRDQLAAAHSQSEALAAANAGYQEQLEQVLQICKPSTSKLANNIRAAIEPPSTEPATAPNGDEPPAHDADVETWARYAEARGFEVSDDMNRSQIRTMLGIPHNTEGADQ